jgi:nicotinate-nucleotide adenylyltransferase
VNVGVLGGTFNPIHLAHLRLAEEMREALALSRVILVPAGDPPLKRAGVAPAELRLDMVRRAAASNPSLEVSDLEVRRSGPSYTVDTLAELGRRIPGARLWFLVGADTLRDLESWQEPARLFELASFAVATRPGQPADLRALLPAALARPFLEGPDGLVHPSGHEIRSIPFTPLAISASDIRRRVARGASLRYLVPDEVIELITKHHLYQEKEDG